jgi:hypothetical protein
MKNMLLPLISLTLLFSLSINCKKEKSNECAACDTKVFVQDFSTISGVLKKVSDSEPYFDGRKYFILIDAEQNLPTLFSQNQNKFERVFPCSRGFIYSDADTGRILNLSGKLFKCTTGKHGLLTNNLVTFNIYEP